MSFGSELRDLRDRVRDLETASPLQNTSVSPGGRLRFIGGGYLLLEAGSLLDGIGTFTWTGPGSIAGDWEVLDGGVIKVGGVLISPIGGGRIFSNGSRLEADADNAGERLIAGDAVVNVGQVASIRKGAASVILSALGITLNGGGGAPITLQGEVRIPLASVPTYASTGLPEGTLRLSSAGRLERADGS